MSNGENEVKEENKANEASPNLPNQPQQKNANKNLKENLDKGKAKMYEMIDRVKKDFLEWEERLEEKEKNAKTEVGENKKEASTDEKEKNAKTEVGENKKEASTDEDEHEV